MIVEFTYNEKLVIHKEFTDEYKHDLHNWWHVDLMEGHQWYEFDKMMIFDEYICYIENDPTTYILYFDGSKCSHGPRVGIVLISPKNEVIPMAYKFEFECINNMEEYEALILGLKSTLILKIKDLEVYGNSHLIINQVNVICITKDEKLQPYKIVIAELLDKFDSYSIQNIPWNNNGYIYVIANAASLAPININDEEIMFTIKKLGAPSYLEYLDHVHVFHLILDDDTKHWYDYIYNYLKIK